MVELYCRNLPLSKDLDPQESMHGEELLFMVCNVLVQVSHVTSRKLLLCCVHKYALELFYKILCICWIMYIHLLTCIHVLCFTRTLLSAFYDSQCASSNYFPSIWLMLILTCLFWFSYSGVLGILAIL